jgi:O-antigen ligase
MRVALLLFFYSACPIVAVISPAFGVAYYSVISIVRPETLTWGVTRISYIFPTALIALLASTLMPSRFRFHRSHIPQFAFLSLYVIALIISTYVSPYRNRQSVMFNNFLIGTLILSVAMVVHLKSLLFLKRYYNLVLLALLFMGTWGFAQWLGGNRPLEGLFGSYIIDRCGICAVFILYFPLAAYKFRTRENFFDLGIGLLGLVIFPLNVVLTESRAGFLGLITALLWLFRYSRRKIAAVVLFPIIVLLFLAFLPDSYKRRLSSLMNPDIASTTRVADTSAASRLAMWKMSVTIFLQHPVLGVGTLNFRDAAYDERNSISGKIDSNLWDSLFSTPKSVLACHNSFLDIFAEGGLLGTLTFYLFIFVSLTSGMPAAKLDSSTGNCRHLAILYQSIKAGVIGYSVAAFFANMRYVEYFYWQLVLLAIVSRIAIRENHENPVNPTDQPT